MKKILLSALSLILVIFMLAACGTPTSGGNGNNSDNGNNGGAESGGNTEGGGDTENGKNDTSTEKVSMTAEEWDMLFSDEALTNVTVTATATEKGVTVSVTDMKLTENGSYIKAMSEGTVTEHAYTEIGDGKYFDYSLKDERWAKKETSEYGGLTRASLLPFDGTGMFDSFEYDEADGFYFANSIPVGDKVWDTVWIMVTDGKISCIAMSTESGSAVEVQYFNYGTTAIEFPEDAINEGDGVEGELPIIPPSAN